MKDMMKFIRQFSLVGLFIPMFFIGIWLLFMKYPKYSILIWSKLNILLLLLWPSAIFIMAAAASYEASNNLLVILIATVLNLVLYTGIGFLVWWGLTRQRWVLYVIIGFILILWYMYADYYGLISEIGHLLWT